MKKLIVWVLPKHSWQPSRSLSRTLSFHQQIKLEDLFKASEKRMINHQ
jgi:hypothetical protein